MGLFRHLWNGLAKSSRKTAPRELMDDDTVLEKQKCSMYDHHVGLDLDIRNVDYLPERCSEDGGDEEPRKPRI